MEKKVRTIPGTPGLKARTDRRSTDGSIREYTILTAGGTWLGSVSWDGGGVGRAAGYYEGHGLYRREQRWFPTLAEAAFYFHGIYVLEEQRKAREEDERARRTVDARTTPKMRQAAVERLRKAFDWADPLGQVPNLDTLLDQIVADLGVRLPDEVAK